MTSATTTTTRSVPAAAPDVRPRFVDLVHAEWLKMWTLRSTRWAIIGSALLMLAMSIGGAIKDYVNWPDYPEGIKKSFVPFWSIDDAVSNGTVMVMTLILAGIGAAMVAGEYQSGLIRTTFAAVPARSSVMAAKLLVAAAVFSVYGAVMVTACFLSSQAILSGRGIGLSITYPEVGRILFVSAVMAPVSVLSGMAMASLIRNAAGAVVAITGVQLLLPFLLSMDYLVPATISKSLPFTAWRHLSEFTTNWNSPFEYPQTTTWAWATLIVWPIASVVIAMAAVRRDP